MAKIKLSGQCEDCRELPVMTRPRRKYTRCEDCRRSHILTKLNVRKVKRALRGSMGSLVQYNNNDGWRVGYLVRMADSAYGGCSIQPIGARGAVPDVIAVPFAGVKPEPMQSASCPTIEDFYRMNEKKKVVVLVAGGRTAVAAAVPRAMEKVIIHGSEPLQTLDGSIVAVQEPNKSTEREQPAIVNTPKVGVTKHPPFDPTEAIRMYQLVPRPKMSEIVEAVRGARAAGATGNLVRAALEKAGLYERPSK